MVAADPFGGATLQINKVFANGRLQRWPDATSAAATNAAPAAVVEFTPFLS
jgi:hypothetical protein